MGHAVAVGCWDFYWILTNNAMTKGLEKGGGGFIHWLFICSTSLRAISEPERLVAQAKSQVAQTKLAYVNRAKSICIHCETFMKESMENFWNGLKMHKNLIKCFQKLNLFGSDFLCSLEAIFPS